MVHSLTDIQACSQEGGRGGALGAQAPREILVGGSVDNMA